MGAAGRDLVSPHPQRHTTITPKKTDHQALPKGLARGVATGQTHLPEPHLATFTLTVPLCDLSPAECELSHHPMTGTRL